jgi:hypothetical protein
MRCQKNAHSPSMFEPSSFVTAGVNLFHDVSDMVADEPVVFGTHPKQARTRMSLT